MSVTSETVTNSLLELGGDVVETQTVTIISGQNLAAGTGLMVSATAGKYTALDDLADAEALILKDACDASAGDKEATVYVAGRFDFATLVLPAGATLKTAQAAFRGTPIFITTTGQL